MFRGTHVMLVATLVASCGVEIGGPPDTDDGKSDNPGSGSGDTPGGMPMPLTATGFLGRIGHQYCDESFRCKATYPTGATGFAQDFGATAADCYTGLDNYYMPSLVEQGIAAGRVLYTETAAQMCLDGITYPTDCATFWTTDPVFPVVCNLALVGKIPDGGACVSIFDCASIDSTCDAATKTCTKLP